MRNIMLVCRYDGTDFSGFQKQANARTVQGDLESALTPLLGHAPTISGAGRTDSGVHALHQVANFRTEGPTPPTDVIQRALNAMLSDDLRIIRAAEVDMGFHSRKSAVSKRYIYKINNDAIGNPFTRRYAWWIPQCLDIEAMRKGASHMVGKRDFSAFQGAGSPRSGTVRNVTMLEIDREGPEITVSVEADGFLYRMVRNIVGCLVEIGRGRLEPEAVPLLIEGRNRNAAPPTAPPLGLYLADVRYPTAVGTD